MVLATQNPIENEGTYPLPEAQLDRFLFKLLVRFPAEAELKQIMEVTVGGKEREITCVSMGNPHCVMFVDNVSNADVEKIGRAIETDSLFPERVNVEFVQVIDGTHIKMRVWERGSGETYACGTGACAAVVAAVLSGYCDMDTDVTVRLTGGELTVKYSPDTVYMTGEACEIFKGVVRL